MPRRVAAKLGGLTGIVEFPHPAHVTIVSINSLPSKRVILAGSFVVSAAAKVEVGRGAK